MGVVSGKLQVDLLEVGMPMVWFFVQVSQVYQAIELKRLAELVPFTNPSDLERIVVEMACTNNIQVGRGLSLPSHLASLHQQMNFSMIQYTTSGNLIMFTYKEIPLTGVLYCSTLHHVL